MPFAVPIVRDQKSRQRDRFGSGQFHASRDHGSRPHQGLDIVAAAGEQIFSPIDGTVVRDAQPYPNDPTFRGVVIQGTEEWEGYEVKMFYVQGLRSGPVDAGAPVGFAQDLSKKYPGITNHVHLEVRKNGVLLSPNELYALCF